MSDTPQPRAWQPPDLETQYNLIYEWPYSAVLNWVRQAYDDPDAGTRPVEVTEDQAEAMPGLPPLDRQEFYANAGAACDFADEADAFYNDAEDTDVVHSESAPQASQPCEQVSPEPHQQSGAPDLSRHHHVYLLIRDLMSDGQPRSSHQIWQEIVPANGGPPCPRTSLANILRVLQRTQVLTVAGKMRRRGRSVQLYQASSPV